MTSPQFEYNTLRPCTEASSPASGVAETHRFGTADISNCACGRYLRTQALNPARQSIKSLVIDAVFNSKKKPCVDNTHYVLDQLLRACQCGNFWFFLDSMDACASSNNSHVGHHFRPGGFFCNCGLCRKAVLDSAPPAITIDRAWLIDFFETTTTRMVETMKKKNADYGGAVPDPFSNFVQVETLGIATAEQGFLTRMTDKLCRVASFAKNGELQVKDESVSDTLLDLANYSLLMMAYLESKRVK